MSFWIIVSWIAVAIMTAINIALFLKLKQASEQMLKMAFPNSKNMGDALSQMQNMMGGMQGRMGGMGGKPTASSGPFAGLPMGGVKGKGGGQDAQLKAAMDMLKNMQKGQKR